uniref:Predicted protein n=1 Tax=Hordeum vulgare subsp. vulgare TaxID=112509 RepID=F2CVY2_HORVV|nr:predicted protein [Hordeum vulgare subsp. vulgare]
MSSTSRIESCGEMKSQELGAQGERDERLCIDFGFKAQDVMEAAACLDEADRREVEQLGYSAFLNLKLGPISQRKETYLCMKLVDLEEDRIKVQLQNDVIVYIRPDEIHHLLMLPQGPKAPLKYNLQQHEDFAPGLSEACHNSIATLSSSTTSWHSCMSFNLTRSKSTTIVASFLMRG